MKKIFYFPILLLFVLPACVKTYKLIPSESSQGSEEVKEKKSEIEQNLRSVKVYNEWETEAEFDVLWVSDQMRKAYVDLYCQRRGKGENSKQEILKKELDRSKESIEFYVVADVRDRFHPSLKDKNSAWTLYLKLSDKEKVMPTKIDEVELEPEIQKIFGYRYSKPKFKIPYLVKFPARDLGDKPFKMIINSVKRKCVLGWQGGHPVVIKSFGKKGKKIRKSGKSEDYYWL